MAPLTLRFALPPTRGNRFVSSGPELLELFLEQALSPAFQVKVEACPDYRTLGQRILMGQAELAWAPPLVCSKVERAGGTVVGQFLREGLLTYRAALVCAKAAPLELKSMRGVRAVWVDKDSAAGYLLPIVHLNRLGVEPGKVFVSQTFAGSLSLALEAVSQGKADLTAVYSRPAQAKTPHTGLDDAPLAIRDRLQIIGYTDEAPNDGIVIASSVPRETVDVLRPRLLSSMREPSAGYMLAQVFNAESLEPAVQGSYSALVRLVTQPK